MPFFFGAHDSSKVTFAAGVSLIENNDHWPGRWYVLTMLQFVRNTKITVTAGHWWMLVTNPRPIIDYLCIFVFVFDFFVFVFVFVLSTLQQVHWREGMWLPLKGFETFYRICRTELITSVGGIRCFAIKLVRFAIKHLLNGVNYIAVLCNKTCSDLYNFQ